MRDNGLSKNNIVYYILVSKGDGLFNDLSRWF
jgi:hypothetical protein